MKKLLMTVMALSCFAFSSYGQKKVEKQIIGKWCNPYTYQSTGELKDGMHSACAFLNSSGGWLIIGITPKSLKIIGQEVTDSTKREIAQALSGIEPAVDVAVEYVDVPEHPGNK